MSQNDSRLLQIHTTGSWLFLEDASDIKKAKFFTGKQDAEGATTLQHWMDYDDLRVLSAYLLAPELLDGKPYWHNTGNGKKGIARLLKFTTRGEIATISLGEGPGIQAPAGVIPDKSKREAWIWIHTNLDRDQRMKLGLYTRDWLISLLNVRSFMFFEQ